MKKYFSSVLCSNGFCCAFNTIYKKDPTAKIYIINGDDYEKAVFFSYLTKLLRGFNITLFNPFYDESTDGIYIENLNTYVLSDGGYNKLYPILPETWEKYINITESKKYPTEILRQVLIQKSLEGNHYKNACITLKKASLIKERLHGELSQYIDEDKTVSFVHRFFSHELKNSAEKGKGEIKLLSSPTPLGFHTHYDTIFETCHRIINIVDENGFIGSVITSIIKNFALKQKISIWASPEYFNNNFFRFLVFPHKELCLCISDTIHKLPFEAHETINASRFLVDKSILNSRKVEILSSVEKSLLEKSVIQIYEGRDERFKYNNLTNDFSNPDIAKKKAKKLAEQILN
jgi:hypothetical protein